MRRAPNAQGLCAQVRQTLAGFGELRECVCLAQVGATGESAAVQYADARRTEAAAAAITAVRVQVGAARRNLGLGIPKAAIAYGALPASLHGGLCLFSGKVRGFCRFPV